MDGEAAALRSPACPRLREEERGETAALAIRRAPAGAAGMGGGSNRSWGEEAARRH